MIKLATKGSLLTFKKKKKIYTQSEDVAMESS